MVRANALENFVKCSQILGIFFHCTESSYFYPSEINCKLNIFFCVWDKNDYLHSDSILWSILCLVNSLSKDCYCDGFEDKVFVLES